MLSYHRLSPKQVSIKRFNSVGGTLGRSEKADWYLPDPERVVSGSHAEISFHKGNYFIKDTSTNGLFINRAIDALGNNTHQLQTGDVLCLGDYEIQVQLIDEHSAINDSPVSDQSNSDQSNNTELAANQISDSASLTMAKNNSQANNYQTINPSDSTSGFSIDQFSSPLKSTPEAKMPQHNNLDLNDHYQAPSALIPDDWDSGWTKSNTPNTAPLQSTTTTKNETVPTTQAKTQVVNTSNATADDQTNLNAFLTGLGLADVDSLTLNSQQWQQLGAALQQSILGLIEIMRARSNIKNSFRVNQTTFQQRENNPLKFSASMDEAFHNLFNRPNSSFMPAKQAIAEAFKDIAQHEEAMLAGVSGISTGLLEQLSPQRFEQSDFNQSFIDKINPAQRQARLWQNYRLTHNSLSNELKKANGGVNDDFINAYEQYLVKR